MQLDMSIYVLEILNAYMPKILVTTYLHLDLLFAVWEKNHMTKHTTKKWKKNLISYKIDKIPYFKVFPLFDDMSW